MTLLISPSSSIVV